MPAPTLLRIAGLFCKIGNLTFGGGDPTMAALHREMVERRGWLRENDYGMSFGLARLTPGTNVLAFCAAAGWYVHGVLGSLVAVIAACAPSAALAVWVLDSYQRQAANPLVQAAFSSMTACVIGIMAGTVAGRMIRRRGLQAVALASGACLLSRVWGISPVVIIVAAAAAGALWRKV
jgi:chromate transporter